ncbi:MAG: hypothetical protein AAF366_09725 [Pseudomonadota bacterium]
MDDATAWIEAASAWWAGLPPVPSLGLPPPPDPDVLIAIGTVVTGLAAMGLVSAWVEKRLSLVSVFALLFGLALFLWVWEADREAWALIRIPEAFVELVARILR